ncbi:MAG: prolyl oligopeptidase family serine peptidase [Gemmatimonadota bacterium]
MHHPLRRAHATLAVVLLLAAPASAQQKPTLTPDDYGRWESLGSATLATDGAWMAYAVSRVDDEDELRIRPTRGQAEERIVAYGRSPAFSADGRWVAYLVGVSPDEREKLEAAKKPIRSTLGLVELASGRETLIPEVATFAFSENGAHLAMRGYAPQGATGVQPSLAVRELASGRSFSFGGVKEFSWQDGGPLLAMVVETQGMMANGVQLYDPRAGTVRSLLSDSSSYQNLTWREDHADLAVLRVVESADHEEPNHTVIAWRGLEGDRVAPQLLNPMARADFPAGMRVVDLRRLDWSEDGGALFFGVKEWEPKAGGERTDSIVAAEDEDGQGAAPDSVQEQTAAPPPEKEEPAGVEVWHARDVDIIPEQKVRANQNRNRNYLAVWHLEPDRFVQLGNELVEDVARYADDRALLGTDHDPYEAAAMFGPVFDDVYTVDLMTGQPTLLRERVERSNGLSPDGRYWVRFEDDHYWVRDLRTGEERNVTAELPTSFVDVEDDHTVEQKPPHGFGGWSTGGRSMLLFDKYDIWEVTPDGQGTRLTDGAADEVRHRIVRLDYDDPTVDLSQSVYVALYGEKTKRYGYGLLRRGKGVERLVFEDASVNRISKAEDADVFLYMKQRFDDSPDWFVAGAGLADATQVSGTNPFQDDYAWGRSELVDFTNRQGVPLQGALFYPADYEPGRQYPMVVYIYEITSNTVHSYTTPSEESAYNTQVFTQNGYFVFRPDIVYRDRNPGLSAADAIIPAVETVLAKGMVDPDQVGIMGHSWGAYQTAFVITQTDLFNAAVAGAPLTDLISMYLSIYWNSGGTDARIFEISQGRMEVPPWEDLESYMANSPLFNIESMNTPLLVAFGDKDGAVDWHQGIELYNAARRAEKDMVMLVYEGENHSLSKEPNRKDYHRRMNEWFAHYLKGSAAPSWITEGKSFLEREKELKAAGQAGGGR